MRPFLFALISSVLLCGCTGTPTDDLGWESDKFTLCPGSPNCVSSTENQEDEEHYIEPFKYPEDVYLTEATEALVKAIKNYPRTLVVDVQEDYLRVEFTSKLWRFVDDVEFYFPDNEHLIHVRSASRLGYSDMGVNRKRIEDLRSAFLENIRE